MRTVPQRVPALRRDLLPFPRYKSTRAILFQFSHAMHVDQKARINPATGFRADCTFCHKFDEQGIFAKFPDTPSAPPVIPNRA